MPSIGAAYSDQEIRNAIDGTEVAGGAGYLSTLSTSEIPTEDDADVTVDTIDELHTEAESGSGRLIWVDDDATIDLSGRKISTSNTIAGNRGQGGSDGPLLYCDSHGMDSSAFAGDADGNTHRGVIMLQGSGTVWGLRLRGPTHDYWDNDAHPGYLPYRVSEGYDYWHSRCLTLRSDDAEVANCEIHGWSTQAMYIGTNSSAYDPWIHHNDLHDNMMTSAGYHIDVANGLPLIEWNYMNAHRHAVDGFGYSGAGWIVQYNVLGPACSQHELDMHSLSNNSSGSTNDYSSSGYHGNAGGSMICRYNTFTNTHIISDANFQSDKMTRAIGIRGVPYPRSGDVVEVYGNRFEHPLTIGERPSPGHQLSESEYEGAVTQQWTRSSGASFDFSSQLVSNDVTPNFYFGDNQTSGSSSTYDPDFGVPGVNLRDDRPTSRYVVTVRDAETASSVQNAEVRVWDSDGEWIRTTDSNGVATFSALPHRQFSVEITASDYEGVETSTSISGDADVTVSLTPTSTGPSVPDMADLTYEVYEYDSGDPIVSAIVTLWAEERPDEPDDGDDGGDEEPEPEPVGEIDVPTGEVATGSAGESRDFPSPYRVQGRDTNGGLTRSIAAATDGGSDGGEEETSDVPTGETETVASSESLDVTSPYDIQGSVDNSGTINNSEDS